MNKQFLFTMLTTLLHYLYYLSLSANHKHESFDYVFMWSIFFFCLLFLNNVLKFLDIVLLFSHPEVSNSLWPHGLQHARPLFLTISWSFSKFMSIALVMPSSHLIPWCPLLLLLSIFPRITDFSNESNVHIKLPKYWSFNFSISPSKEYSGSISSLVWPCCPRISQKSFSSTIVRRHQFFSTLPSLRSSSHNSTWPLGRP